MSFRDVKFAGPRPLTLGDEIAGREDPIDLIVSRCRTSDVIAITGNSGVGKSSFVHAGLLKHLSDSEHYHLYPTPDKRSGSGTSYVPWTERLRRVRGQVKNQPDVVAAALYRDLVGLPIRDSGDVKALFRELTELAERHPQAKPVVVLDQFEELIRYYRAVAEVLLDIVARVAVANGVPHIVVARSEYRDDFRPLDRHRNAVVFHYPLPELSPAELGAAFAAPFKAAHVDVDKSVIAHIQSWWSTAREQTNLDRIQQVGAEATPDVGLLHVQTLGWSIVDWVKQEQPTIRTVDEREQFDLELLQAYVAARTEDGASPDQGALLHDGLGNYVQSKAQAFTLRADLVNPRTGEPLRWRLGPATMVARVAPSFTVSGFKQPQDLFSLVPGALAEMVPRRRAAELGEDLTQAGMHRRTEVLERYSKYAAPSGIAIADDWGVQEVLPEVVDALHAGLEALSHPDVNLLRRLGRGDEPIYELVHDGIGAALKAWAADHLERPPAILGSVAEMIGGYVAEVELSPASLRANSDIPVDAWGSMLSWPDEGPPTITGLAWTGSRVEASTVTGIVFEQANFTGSTFIEAVFEDVVFRNCTFQGVSFVLSTLTRVRFENCQLGAAIVTARSRLDDVKINDDRSDGRNLDLLTVDNLAAANGVHFNVPHLPVQGLFLRNLPAGEWTLDIANLSHLVATSEESTTIRLVNGAQPDSTVGVGVNVQAVSRPASS